MDIQILPIPHEKISQFALHSWTKYGRSDRLVLRCNFKINTQDQIQSNLELEQKFRAKDLNHLQGTMICAYPASNIIPTICDSEGDYGKWMSDLLELYDGIIFARKFGKGVAFLLD